MATITNSVKLTFEYKDKDTKTYDFSIDEDEMMGVSFKVKAVNASLTSGTDNGLSSFFVSKAGASLAQISEAQIISISETVLDLSGGE